MPREGELDAAHAGRTSGVWFPGFGVDDADVIRRVDIASAASGGEPSLFDTPEWLTTATRLVPPRDELWTLRLSGRAAAPAAAVPFVFGSGRIYGVPASLVRPLGAPLSDRFAPARAPAAAWSVVLSELMAAPCAWDVAVLSELTPTEAERADVEAWARERGVGAEFRLCGRAPLIDLTGLEPGTLAGTYSRKMRKTLNQARSRMDRAAKVEITTAPLTTETLDEAFSVAYQIDRRSWKGAGGSSLFADAARIGQVRDATLLLMGQAEPFFRLLRMDGRPISYGFGWIHQGVYLDYQTSYDAEYASFSPGKYLMHAGLEGLIALRVTRYDASRGSLLAPSMVYDWTKVDRPHYRLFLYRNTPAGLAAKALSLGVRPLALKLREARAGADRAARRLPVAD